MAVEISRKLCLTAAWLRVDTRKELAAAFRSINSATTFDAQRAHKWLQGRSLPRGSQIYEDWARLVALGEPAEWIADCPAEQFLERLSTHHGVAPEALRRRADAYGGSSALRQAESRERELVGNYACYSPAWSSYYRGHLIRGTLSIAPAPGIGKLRGSYRENLPIGSMELTGAAIRGERVITAHLGDPLTSAQLFLWLLTPAPPTTVLAGMLTGTTLMSRETQLAASRLILIRLPATSTIPETPAYLGQSSSIAADLALSGLLVEPSSQIDLAVTGFLGAQDGRIDQLTATTYRDVVELFDRHWLEFESVDPDRRARQVAATVDRR